eukprot:COSAG04_NODE_2041_length_4943_cov_2.912335_2_plen_107_part_00
MSKTYLGTWFLVVGLVPVHLPGWCRVRLPDGEGNFDWWWLHLEENECFLFGSAQGVSQQPGHGAEGTNGSPKSRWFTRASQSSVSGPTGLGPHAKFAGSPVLPLPL